MAKPKYLACRSAVLQALRGEPDCSAPAGEELDFSRLVAFTILKRPTALLAERHRRRSFAPAMVPRRAT